MAIKRFLISSGDGDTEESTFNSDGKITIAYDDSQQKIILSDVHISGSITVEGNLTGTTLTGSLSGSTVTNSVGGGASNSINIEFTKIASSVAVGDIVAVGASGLAKCNKSNNLLSNVIGVVASSGSGVVTVQVCGETEIVTGGNYSTGSLMYAGSDGNAVTYDQLVTGDYVTQVGIMSGNGTGKLIIQPRIFGQL